MRDRLVYSIAVFGPFGLCTGGNTYNVDAWGLGHNGSGCPDVVPTVLGHELKGLRINCELGPGFSNVQTFLGVSDGAIPTGAQSSSSQRSLLTRIPEPPRLEDMARTLRVLQERLLLAAAATISIQLLIRIGGMLVVRTAVSFV